MAATFTLRAKIEKVQPDEHIASGWMYVSEEADGTQVVDASGEYIVAGDLERAAYDYVLASRASSIMHEQFTNADGEPVAQCCASVVTTREVQAAWGLADGAMPVGWWVSFYVTDEALWQLIKSGEVQMFSIGGSAVSSPDAPQDQAT